MISFNWRFGPLLALAFVAALPAKAWSESPIGDQAAGIEFFEKKIRPLLVDNCYTCHSADTNSRGGLRVDDRNGLIHGGERGPAIVPGHPEQSLLIRAVSQTDDDLKMPPMKQLTSEQVADLTRWIQDGAAWPQVIVTVPIGKPNPRYEQLRKSHWSWQPIVKPPIPSARDVAWPLDSIDNFIRAKLDEQDLAAGCRC